MKHRIFVSLVALGAAVLLTPLASGSWSGFRSLGTTKVVGTPSCVQLGADEEKIPMQFLLSQHGRLLAFISGLSQS